MTPGLGKCAIVACTLAFGSGKVDVPCRIVWDGATSGGDTQTAHAELRLTRSEPQADGSFVLFGSGEGSVTYMPPQPPRRSPPMRARFALSLSVLLVPPLLQAQVRSPKELVNPIIRATVAATVTVPALSFHGSLGGVSINLAYSRANIGAGGSYLDLIGPTSNSLAGAVIVSALGALPNGSYAVQWDFVNVGAATQLAVTGPTGTTLTTCSLNAVPGYNNVQSCTLSLSISNGSLLVSIQPTSGVSMTLKQVTVTRYQ